MYLNNPLTLSSFGLILVACVFRQLALKKISTGVEVTTNLALFHNACMLVISLGWALYWYDIDHFYGRYSVQGVFALMTLSAFVSGGVSPQSPKPMNYVCFSFFMFLFPTYMFFKGLDENFFSLASCISLYIAYCFYQLRVSHLTIKRLILNELQTSSEYIKLQTLINAVPGYVCFINQELRYVMINELGKTAFKMHDHIGRSIQEDHPDSDFVKFVTEFMSGEKTSAVVEMPFMMGSGKTVMFMSIQRNPGLLGGAAVVAIPMEELIESREKVKSQEIKTFHTAKLVSLGEMAAGIAHEINNPLAIILGCSDQITRSSKKTPPDLATISVLNEKIQGTVERIAAIIKSLRILSGNGEREPFKSLEAKVILEHGIQLSRRRFQEENVELIISYGQENIRCYGQETQLSQVMMNLLSNAFDAAVTGGEPRWVRIHVAQSEDWVTISIQDSGDGISTEVRQRIMEPFFTTKPLNKGTGLGLSISKSIMDQHQGSLTLEDSTTPTTFIVRLKAAL